MSGTTSVRQASRPPGEQAGPASSAGQEQGSTLGLISATGLVLGSIIGTGVFTMPVVMAAAAPAR